MPIKVILHFSHAFSHDFAVPCTATEEDMLSNKIQLKWKSAEKLYSESGDMVEFICRRGFQPDPSSPPFRVQCTDGRLEYPRCTPPRMYIEVHQQ